MRSVATGNGVVSMLLDIPHQWLGFPEESTETNENVPKTLVEMAVNSASFR